MDKIYEDEVEEMSNLLKETIDKFEKGYEVSIMEPLFCISKKQFELLDTISRLSNYQVRNGCWRLCEALCKQMNIDVENTFGINNIDFLIRWQGRKVGISVAFKANYMPEVEEIVMEELDELLIVVLQDAKGERPLFYRPNNSKYRNYKYREKIKNITMQQFFEMLGRSDYDDFRECVARYNYDAEQALGITVSAIPTKKAIEKHKINVKRDLLSYFYEEELLSVFTSTEIADMKIYFEKNCQVVISDADFAKSFISSEWYYDLQVKTDGGLEQTAIVAGYLKSLEQFLCAILLVLSDNGKKEFMFDKNKLGKKLTGEGKLPLSNENMKLIHTMARNLLNVIKSNPKYIMRNTTMTFKVISYLDKYVYEIRNNYLHKGNLYELTDIEDIREKTYATIFMILGTFFIDVEKISEVRY